MAYDDTNLNVDFTEYRAMSNNMGRWHSADPLGGDLTNPQSLNRYAYVLNNPTGLIDPLGLDSEQCSQSNKGCDDPCDNPNYVGADAAAPAGRPDSGPPTGAEDQEAAAMAAHRLISLQATPADPASPPAWATPDSQ